MKRPRDSQRTRFWKAFRAWDDRHEVGDNLVGGPDGAQKFLEKIESSRWFKSEGFTRLVYRTKRGKKDSIKFSSPTIIRCNEKTTIPNLLKIYAHILQPSNTAWHGREYCKILLDLVERWTGIDDDSLRVHFTNEKVKYRLKRQLSEVTKQSARMRLAKINSTFMKELKDL